MGRIHEIFGPTVKPYYTVRVEGTATQHQLVVRYQMAVKKLLDAEKVMEEKKRRRDGTEGRKGGREGEGHTGRRKR